MSRVTWLMMQAREGKMTEGEAMAEIDRLREVDGLKQAEDEYYRAELSHQHNISINGGTEKTGSMPPSTTWATAAIWCTPRIPA